MRTRAQELWVGVFVVLAAAALFFLAMRVSGLVSLFNSSDTYTLNASFNNVGSLTPRAKVALAGVTVGKVSSIELDEKLMDSAVVTLEIEKKYNKITTDTYASISTAGLLGEQFISLEPGSEETYFKDGDVIEDTQSAMVLEDLIRKFVVNKTSEAASDGAADTSSTALKAGSQSDDSFEADDASFGDF